MHADRVCVSWQVLDVRAFGFLFGDWQVRNYINY